ncbi:MAG: HEAT repeat domain-containing protein [Pirellulaceae bacterium]|nr:HEAT repeat domain-containing protein [Pirellulaceae bacterium]
MSGAILHRRLLAAALALAPLCAALADENPAADSPAARRLAELGLSPSAPSLGGYLASLRPSPDQEALVRTQIERLGSDDYAQREEAGRLLLRQISGITPFLEQALAGNDPEIRWRAKRILDQTQRESKLLLGAVLAVIHEQKVRGLAGPLFGAVPFCGDNHLRLALRKALAASATPADAPLLREQLTAADPHLRIAAIATLSVAVGTEADPDARRLLNDSEELVRSAAARVLADHGRRECLPVLVKLLESAESPVRLGAIQTLRQLTGQHFNYRGGYDAAERRAASIAAWQTWLARDGATAPLLFPLRDAAVDLGRLLVCDHSQHLLIEFDTAGRKTWQRNVGNQPWACLGLASGNRLVGSYADRTIVEYDDQGEEVWRAEGLPGGPTSIQRLENGNTLVACTEGSQVVEIDPARKTVWTVAIEGRPVDARRLDDGNTLITLQHSQKVVEVDPAGKVVWEISGLGMAFSAERLEGGTTLVCALGHNKIREFDRTGKVVWEKGAFSNPYCAQRLASGNTIVVDTTGVTEIDPQGAVVSRVQMSNVSRAWRY